MRIDFVLKCGAFALAVAMAAGGCAGGWRTDNGDPEGGGESALERLSGMAGRATRMRRLPSWEPSEIERSVENAQGEAGGGRVLYSDTTSEAEAYVRRDLPVVLLEKDPGLLDVPGMMPAKVFLYHLLVEVMPWLADGRGLDWDLEVAIGGPEMSRAEALDLFAAALDAHWWYADGMVRLAAQHFRHHDVPASLMNREGSMGATSLNSGGGGGGESSGGSGASEGGENSLRLSVDPSAEIEAILAQVMAGEPQPDIEDPLALPSNTAELALGAGQVVAFGRPSFHARVERALAGYLRAAQRRVSVDLALYEVDVTDGRQRAISIEAVRRDIGNFGGSLGITLGAQTGSVGAGAADGGITFSADPRPSSGWSEVESVLTLLDSQGDTELAHHVQLEAQHAQMVSVEGITATKYISQVGRENFTTGPSQTQNISVNTDDALSGTAIQVIPFISPGEVDLHISISRAEVSRIDTYEFGDIQGSLPTIEGDAMLLRVALRDGESRLLFNLGRRTVTRQRARNPLVPFLSRSGREDSREIEVVMLVAAKVLT